MVSRKSGSVTIDKLAEEIELTLEDFARGVGKAMEDAALAAGHVAENQLHKTSPVGSSGDYRRSWDTDSRMTSARSGIRTSVTVYSQAPHYRLTHLLEFGHKVAGAKRPGAKTFVDARPHIAAAQTAANEAFIAELKKRMDTL